MAAAALCYSKTFIQSELTLQLSCHIRLEVEKNIFSFEERNLLAHGIQIGYLLSMFGTYIRNGDCVGESGLRGVSRLYHLWLQEGSRSECLQQSRGDGQRASPYCPLYIKLIHSPYPVRNTCSSFVFSFLAYSFLGPCSWLLWCSFAAGIIFWHHFI